MRTLLLTAACAAMLASCSPPAQQSEAPSTTDNLPSVVACNTVTPDPAHQITIQEAPAAAAAVADLRGGRITPGVYDLTSAQRVGAATGWPGARAVAVDVAENPNGGVTLNWAGTIPGGNVDRWTATLTETPTVRVAYTCGRIGEVDADFAAAATTLQLRMPDGADGHLVLDFQRRG